MGENPLKFKSFKPSYFGKRLDYSQKMGNN